MTTLTRCSVRGCPMRTRTDRPRDDWMCAAHRRLIDHNPTSRPLED